MQRTIFFVSGSSRHAAAHFRQAAAAALQAAMQSAYREKFSCTLGRIIGVLLWGWAGPIPWDKTQGNRYPQ
jgi:hypothetical protein